MNQLSAIASGIREVLLIAMGSWNNEEAAQGLSAGSQVPAIRADCQALYGKLSQLALGPGDTMPYVNLLLICRQLDRISRHDACVAEQAANAAPVSKAR
jgi:hypothetical protein